MTTLTLKEINEQLAALHKTMLLGVKDELTAFRQAVVLIQQDGLSTNTTDFLSRIISTVDTWQFEADTLINALPKSETEIPEMPMLPPSVPTA